MISPQHLIQILIREQIPYAEFPISINEGEIDKLIKISHLQVAYAHNRLIYILHILLLTSEKYTLYRPIPLPVKQEFDTTKFAIIKPNVEYIGLNENADNFLSISRKRVRRMRRT